ncbi:MAG: c-type cytochrome, partial [Planctomycetaceae bacterium]
EHAVLTDILEPQGSGFIGRHGDDFALANNAAWIGFSVEIGPQGDVYVLDWHDGDICGMDVLHKNTGRIFRFSPVQSQAKDFKHRNADLNTLSSLELARLQLVESAWHARQARTILQHRATAGDVDAGTIAELKSQSDARTSTPLRLNALWALHLIGALTPAELTSALDDRDPSLRAWAIQLLCEDFAPPAAALSRFVQMAKHDASPVVRLYLAAALQRIPRESVWDISEGLAQFAEDAEDHNIPKMIWFGLSPDVPQNADRALQLARTTRIPLLSRHIARRLTEGDQLEAVVNTLAAATAAQEPMLLGVRDGLEGRYDVKAPASWPDVYTKLRAGGGENARIALQLSQQFGDSVAAETLLKTLQDDSAELADRLDALQGLTGRRRPELKPVLLSLLSDGTLRPHAIRAMAAFDDGGLSDALLEHYSTLSDEDKLEAVHTLASRSESGWKLTQAIKNGSVPRRDIPAWVARLLRRVVGNGFVEVWGSLDELAADKEALFVKYRTLLTEDAVHAADPAQGRRLYNRTCAACHKLHGLGGVIGPDITGANRSNLEYLLGNILTPSAVIQDAYRMHLVVTNDGRVWSGIPAEENDRQLRLRIANQEQPVIINKSEIESRDIAPVSMMPEGQLTTMTDKEVLDLIAYLQTQRQVSLPDDHQH